MDQRVSIITLGVSDLQKAKAFYDGLGWKEVEQTAGEEIIAYDLHAMTLTLYPWDKLAEDAGVSSERAGSSAITLAYNVSSESEVDETITHVKTLGATITKPPQKAFWGGYSACFQDLDGHIWEVACNPFSKLGPKGEFQWLGVNE